MRKKVIWFESYNPCCDEKAKSQEELLKEKALVGEIWLIDEDTNLNEIWGDDWNDAPSCCNSGEPYKKGLKGLQKVKVYLGKSLDIEKLRGRNAV